MKIKQHLARVVIVASVVFVGTSCSETNSVGRVQAELKKKEKPFDPHFDTLPKNYKDLYADTIRDFFYENLGGTKFNGMFLVAKNGQIIFEHYQGLANEEAQVQMSSKTSLHVASISKTVTAIAILRLVDEQKIELDKDIRSYIPGIPYEGITVRSLLNHRSGIPYYGYFPTTIWPSNKTMRNADIVTILNQHQLPLYFPPNTQFSYCNTNYALLALIIEKVTAKRFPNAMKELIFDPLKMENTFIFEPSKQVAGLSQSYNSKGVLQEATNLDEIYGDKNVYTTARDLLKLDRATYADDFLSKKIKAEMYKGYSYERPGKSNYGLGMRMREEAGKSTFFFHTGWWHGNTGCYVSMRADSVCMVVISNHYTKSVFGINKLSLVFGDYPFAPLVDTKENFVNPAEAKKKLNSDIGEKLID